MKNDTQGAAVPAQPDAIPVQTLIELHQGLAANLHDGPARNLHLATAAALNAQRAAERGAPAERVYLVNTGEIRNGHELYERHERPVPLADQEVLYTSAPAQPAPEPAKTLDEQLSVFWQSVEDGTVFNVPPETKRLIEGAVQRLRSAGASWLAADEAQPAPAQDERGYEPMQGLAAYLRAEAIGVSGVAAETLRIWASEVDAARAAAPVAAAPAKGLPYDPNSNMLIAARACDPALPIETIRAIWWAMWRAAPQPPAPAAAADALDEARKARAEIEPEIVSLLCELRRHQVERAMDLLFDYIDAMAAHGGSA